VRLDRKLLLIAPTIVLVFVFAGMTYAARQLHVLSASVSSTFKDRSDYIAAVQRGEKPLEAQKAIGLLAVALDVEEKRSTAISAMRDLLLELSVVGLISCAVLGLGIRSVPREHWPRFGFERSQPETQ
jgi:hypothetical protein